MGKVLKPHMILQVYFNLNRFPTDEFAFLERFNLQDTHTLIGGTIYILNFSANIKWNLFNPVMTGGPFLLSGIGVLSRSLGDATISSLGGPTIKLDGDKRTAPTLALGGGVDIPIGDNNYIFVEFKYTIAFIDPITAYLPVKIGFMW